MHTIATNAKSEAETSTVWSPSSETAIAATINASNTR